MVKMQDLRDQSDEQIILRKEEIKKSIFDLRNELKTVHKLEKPHMMRELKKEKARLLTVLNERKLGIRKWAARRYILAQ